MKTWPDPVLRVALWIYSLLWYLLFPVVWLYLRNRGRSDPLYIAHMNERFGGSEPYVTNPIWVHAVSMGEMRSASPLIRALLDQGETIVTTHFTPAGRVEAKRSFAKEIAEKRLQVVWVPFEFGFAYRRFLRRFQPKLGLVMEIEVWPMMILMARKVGTPLYMCNAQYPQKSYDKDQKGLRLRARLFGGFSGAFVKSEGQRQRLADCGLPNISITGELRFDQPIPQSQLDAAAILRPKIAQGREVITLTSVVEGEDATYIDMIKNAQDKVFIYVPRAQERFDDVHSMLISTGLRVVRRSEVLDSSLSAARLPDCDVLLGDSMGEMYFYLGLCDRAIVGGGFVPKGAHNIIEPLALKKPVIVGPYIWTITYPAVEAIEAGVCQMVETPEALKLAVAQGNPTSTAAISAFYATHAGGTKRTLTALDVLFKKSA